MVDLASIVTLNKADSTTLSKANVIEKPADKEDKIIVVAFEKWRDNYCLDCDSMEAAFKAGVKFGEARNSAKIFQLKSLIVDIKRSYIRNITERFFNNVEQAIKEVESI